MALVSPHGGGGLKPLVLSGAALAAALKPQIAFLDIGMPRMDGYEAARQIRDTLGPGVTLVALTGWGQDEDKRRSLEAGFDHHLTKPVDMDELARLLNQSGLSADQKIA